MKRKLIALAGALLLAVCPLTGCGNSGRGDTPQSDLPYGATLNTADLQLQVRYDNRFIEDALAEKISAFYLAVQEQDADAYANLQFPLYHEYAMGVVYKDQYTDADIVKMLHDAYEENYQKEFDFALIDVTDIVTRDGTSATRDALSLMLQQLASDMGDQSFTKDLQSLFELTNDCYLCDRGSGKKGDTVEVTKASQLFTVKYKNEWYLIYN